MENQVRNVTVVLKNVSKMLGKRYVLKSVSMAAGAGMVTVIVGPNGSGKTTLLKIIAGLVEPDEGEVWVNGRLVSGQGQRIELDGLEVGYVPQEVLLFPHMNVYENIAFGLRVRNAGESIVEERVRWAARMLGVEKLLDRMPSELSGGEAQRVAIARALAVKPKLLLMDEPFSHIDPWSRDELRILILSYARQENATVILTTHDLQDIEVADQVYTLSRGSLRKIKGGRRLGG